MQELYNALLNDLYKLGFNIHSFKLVLRPYSKSYFGRYYIATKEIYLYVFEDEKLKRFLPYYQLLDTLIHEAVHAKQSSNKNFVRKRGVMHDPEFKTLYNKYHKKMLELRAEKEREVVLKIC